MRNDKNDKRDKMTKRLIESRSTRLKSTPSYRNNIAKVKLTTVESRFKAPANKAMSGRQEIGNF